MTLATTARADTATARQHFALAESAERRSDWKSAIDEYKQAYAAEPSAAVLYNIAADYEHLSDWADAADFYQRYLTGAPDADDRGEVAAKIKSLRARAPVTPAGAGALDVRTENVEGAKVTIDNTDAGTTPLHVELPPGDHVVVLSMDGYAPQTIHVKVHAGGTEVISPTLVAVAAPPTPAEPRRFHLVVGGDYGVDVKSGAARFVIYGGLRVPNDRLEASLVYGISGAGDKAFGAESRVFFAVGKVRPFARASVSFGTSDAGKATYGFEGGGGVTLALITSGAGRFEYFAEMDVRYTGGGDPMVTGVTVGTKRIIVPIEIGLSYPF